MQGVILYKESEKILFIDFILSNVRLEKSLRML